MNNIEVLKYINLNSKYGMFLRNRTPDAIMIYTPTMLERAQVYSGKRQDEHLAIIISRKGINN